MPSKKIQPNSLTCYFTGEQLHFLRRERMRRNLVPLAQIVRELVEEARLRALPPKGGSTE